MPRRSLESMREAIGTSVATVEDLYVEAGKVEEFARAVGDDNPVYRSETAAREQGLDGIPAPPTFTRVGYFPRYLPDDLHTRYGGDRPMTHDVPFELGFDDRKTLHAGQSYDFDRPVIVGDTLAGESTLTDLSQRTRDDGTLLTFCTVETAYRDSDDEPVVTETFTRVEVDESGGQ